MDRRSAASRGAKALVKTVKVVGGWVGGWWMAGSFQGTSA